MEKHMMGALADFKNNARQPELSTAGPAHTKKIGECLQGAPAGDAAESAHRRCVLLTIARVVYEYLNA